MKILITILFLSLSARAETWIIKNPKTSATLRDSSYSVLKFENEYLILKTNERISQETLLKIFQAEAAFQDIPIAIDEPEITDVPIKAWHPDYLKYSELNSKYEGQDVIVAVLDYGVDYSHNALKDHMWKNEKEIPDNQIDDDQNGLVDDYHGYNFADNNIIFDDPYSHGTHCAGIIVAEKDPESGGQGVAPRAKVMSLQIQNKDYAGFLSTVARATKYAVDNGAKVLSNSWKIYYTMWQFAPEENAKFLDEAINYAEKHNAIFVAAAGNEKRNLDVTTLENPILPLSLRNHKNMIGVASIGFENNEEHLSKFSNYGKKMVAVSAPGENIYSTITNNRWRMMSGTSMATPLVAGVLARGISKGMTPEKALDRLERTSDRTKYWKQYTTHGKINIKKYLD